MVEQPAGGGVIDRLVEGVGADADRGPAEIELADIDGVERAVPGLAAARQDVGLGDRVVVEREVGDVVLRVAEVLHALVSLVPRIDHEEDVVVGLVIVRNGAVWPGHLAEDRDQRRLVGVADVVLLAPRQEGPVRLRKERHLARVEIRAVLLLGQPEGEDAPLLQQASGVALDLLVAAHPDRPEAEDRHLPGVPVGQAVEAEDLVEFAVAPGVPAASLAALVWRGEEGGEEPAILHEVEEVPVPDPFVIVVLDPRQPLRFEEVDDGEHQLAVGLVRVRADAALRVEQHDR